MFIIIWSGGAGKMEQVDFGNFVYYATYNVKKKCSIRNQYRQNIK